MRRFFYSFLPAIVTVILLTHSPHSQAETLEPAPANPILTITGSIGATHQNGAALFDIAMLEKIGLKTLETKTPWTEGVTRFEGVLMRDLMAAVKAQGKTVIASAINDYKSEIPLSDFTEMDVILATRIAGQPLSIRDKGPLWIIYPFDAVPNINDEVHYNRCVWQLIHFEVRDE